MRAVVQRVSSASVSVGEHVAGRIEAGLLVYLGVACEDEVDDAAYLAEKVRYLRIFPDDEGRMNRDVVAAGGAVLVVSAFTVQADARKGRRPTFEGAAPRAEAVSLYERFCETLADLGVSVARGAYGEDMAVHSVNAGPVCILLDSRRAF
ncbi:MAG: D-tyrosyl-tRNA(Tyr) deacylase [Planctomycetota bacterium]|nr:MAG: D-tyrosyl-tRNA(Tyr) deacylase [Planctomycetota bacterium]